MHLVPDESENLRFRACGLKGRSVYPPLAWKRAGRGVSETGRAGSVRWSFGFQLCRKG